MKLILERKEEVLDILEMLNLEGKHLHRGLWVQKAVLIEDRSTFIRMDRSTLKEALPLLRSRVCSYPIMMTADTLRDGLALDIKITKTREEYILEFDAAPAKPIKEFLIKEYEKKLDKFLNQIRDSQKEGRLKRKITRKKREAKKEKTAPPKKKTTVNRGLNRRKKKPAVKKTAAVTKKATTKKKKPTPKKKSFTKKKKAPSKKTASRKKPIAKKKPTASKKKSQPKLVPKKKSTLKRILKKIHV